MRLLCTINNQKQALSFSSFLTSQGISNEIEIHKNIDWGSSNYGDHTCHIWIIDEDVYSTAKQWWDLCLLNPNDPRFNQKQPASSLSNLPLPQKDHRLPPSTPPTSPTSFRTSIGTITFYILMTCCVLFIADMLTSPTLTIKTLPTSIPATPIVSSSIKRELYYDYPKAFEIIEKLARSFGEDNLQNPQDLPSEGKVILNQFYNTPYWQGIYPIVLQRIQHSKDSQIAPIDTTPLFEKERQGELWRLFTPCLLHYDILHILFNMLWLVMLGKQIEERLSPFRYLALIGILGVFSNTCQYLMSGSNFIGFSGVLCGMLTFIWMRQKIAAWEGYPLQSSTIKFMIIFIFAMFTIELFSFYLEAFHNLSISPGIANTAHLSGALMGIILGSLPFFAIKHLRKGRP